MKIFVTGATGFLGSHLVPLLYREKHKVLLLSRSASKNDYIKGDLADLDIWKNKVKRFKPDAAIHFAWEGVANYNATSPDIALKNIVNSINLVRLLGAVGCKRFVALGSVTDYSPAHLTPFSVSKTSFRVLGEATARQYGMEFFWASPFYIYGPGQRKEALLPHVINSLLGGTKPDIKNPGLRQDFIYVEDVARALLLIAEKGEVETNWYQIGSGETFFICHLLNIINKKFGIKDEYQIAIAGAAAPLVANIDALKRLGWRQEISLENGIGKTVDYYRNKLS